jgi:L-fuculose-phosphate aldolase
MTTADVDTGLRDLAVACRVLALYGHEDKALGHLSWRDPAGRGLWLKRAHVGLAEIETAKDFVLIDFKGERLAGDAPLHKEWPIHTEIMLARPDVNIVGHTHPFYACLFAATEEPLRAIGHEGCYFNADVPRYRGTSFLIDTIPLGKDLAQALGAHKVVLMNNHGLTFCGGSLAEAAVLGITIEKACKQQLTLAASGYRMVEPDREEIAMKARNLANIAVLDGFWAYYKRQLARYETGHGPLVVL